MKCLVTLFTLVGITAFAQKSILVPPTLELNFPDITWEMTSEPENGRFWNTDFKKIKGLNDRAEITVYCFYENIMPDYWTPENLDWYKNPENPERLMNVNGFSVYPVGKYKGSWTTSAWKRTEDGSWVILNVSLSDISEESANKLISDILNASNTLTLTEMDRKFGYPLDPKANNSEFIERRKLGIVNYYCPDSDCKGVSSEINRIPLDELAPELHDGFSYKRLFGIWDSLVEGTISINTYFDALLLDQNSQNLELYFEYADKHDGSFLDAEIQVLNHHLQGSFDEKDFFVEQGYDVDKYMICNSERELTHIWRAYQNESQDKAVVLCFHKGGTPLTDPSDWQITESKAGTLMVVDKDPHKGHGSFYSLSAEFDYEEEKREEATARDMEELLDPAGKQNDLGYEEFYRSYGKYPPTIDHEFEYDCDNSRTSIFALYDFDAEGIESLLLGVAANPNSSFVKVNEAPIVCDVLYTIRSMDNLNGRYGNSWSDHRDITDSISYDELLNPNLKSQFYEMNFERKEKLLKQIDTAFLASQRGHSFDGINVSENVVFYAIGSQVFNLPPEKRVYSSGFYFEDLNGDGKQDPYRFMVSNGKLINVLVSFEKDGQVIVDSLPEKYETQFMNSKVGRLMKRLSLQEKNLLTLQYLDILDEEEIEWIKKERK